MDNPILIKLYIRESYEKKLLNRFNFNLYLTIFNGNFIKERRRERLKVLHLNVILPSYWSFKCPFPMTFRTKMQCLTS
jgi:hypothetical protein